MSGSPGLAASEDVWLSKQLSQPVFTVVGPEPDLAALREHARGRRTVMYQAKVPTGRVDILGKMAELGFRVVNTGVMLARKPASADTALEPAEYSIRRADSKRDADIVGVAGVSFLLSRFHLDPAIQNDLANQIKREWVASYLRGERGDGLMIAEADGRSVGFLAVLAANREAERVRTIDLIGVHPAWRGVGVGRRLVTRFLTDSVGSCDVVEVGTQAANPGAIRFYERLDFSTQRTFYDLHMHL